MLAHKRDVNIAICGHAWHGKSTLLGKTVADMGMVRNRRLKQAQEAAREGRDPSLIFACLVARDKNPQHEDLQTGITVNPAFVRFHFPKHRVTVIDTPGQEKYTNNRFSAIFQADGALLVVDVVDKVMPVTRHILRILKGYEIPLLGVTISKMDRVNYSQEAFEEAVASVREELAGLEFEDATPQFFPSSAYEPQRDIFAPGEGTVGFQRITWWEGPSLKSFMEGLSEPAKESTGPLRIVIHSSSVYDNVPGVGKTVTGLLESGQLKKNQRLIFEPVSTERQKKLTARVRSIELTRGHAATPGIPLEVATPRQLVGIALTSTSFKESLRELFQKRGILAGPPEAPPPTTCRFLCRLTVFSSKHTLDLGDQWMLHCHADRVMVVVKKISSLREEQGTDWREGEFEQVQAGQWAKVQLETQRPVALEQADTLARLSRIVLRDGDTPLAYGVCLKRLDD